MKWRVPTINLDEYEIERSALARLPRQLCDERGVIPVAVIPNALIVAMTDPDDRELIEMLARHAQCEIEPLVAPSDDIARALRKYRDRVK
jgi:type IV pilus assembly protein PilB